MTIDEQVRKAVAQVSALFKGYDAPLDEPMPEDATAESLWTEVKSLRAQLHALRRSKRGVRPKVQDAVRLLLEDPDLAGLTIGMIAEVVRATFVNYGLKCECKTESVRWYISQYNLEWEIVARRLIKPEVPTIEVPTIEALEPETDFDRCSGEEKP